MLIGTELAVLLACIVIGARLGGIGLGTIPGIGLLLFVFVFRLPPDSPPGTVLGMIIAVIAEVARQVGVRPERPISASVTAAQCGVIASPIAAATVIATALARWLLA